ncbi:type IV pilus secretin PilQ [Thiohalorhabdus denitrificans]|uniref:Type IV pilus assembly protein PilQ n=1 Tax=Thiohalorhabdus denitrificans TaxID=381306 RepID=A0A1G5EFI0_9GAMM|nr:type IV pilus secretin PilQ [Thiohalorhabdus denitrificans]SCY25218.1 type IV pilus assembly protein PilQ [Thiohalorhabdus denitrificans]
MAGRISWLTAAFLVFLAQALVSTAAMAEVQVSKVELFEEGEETGLLLTGDGPLTYRLLSQEEPPRVLVQLPDAAIEESALPETASEGLVEELTLHTSEGQPPRLELRLSRVAEASATREGAALAITLAPAKRTNPASAEMEREPEPEPQPLQARPEPEKDAGPLTLEDFDLKEGAQGASLTLKTSREPRQFQSFQLDDPRRLVVDLQDAKLGVSKNRHPQNHPLIERVRFGQGSDHARTVLDLKGQVTHNLEPAPEGLRVSLRRPSRSQDGREVTDVDFTVGPEPDVGRVELSLDSTGAEAQVQLEEGRVVMDLPKTRLPEELEKRLQVTDFGTVVESVDLYQREDAVRVVASGKGPLEPTTYQLDDKLVLNVGKRVSQEAKKGPEATGEPYQGEKLSLNFQNIEVRQALNILADFADLNMVASDSVGGQLTLRLNDVPWDQALDIILDSQGLGMDRRGNVIRVAPQAELQQQAQQELEAEQKRRELVPLRTEILQINYAKASEVKALLESQGEGEGGMLSRRGSISVDERTNSLLVRETPEQLRAVRQMVEKLDRPTRQVMIEARIVKVNTSFERQMGVRWGGFHTDTTGFEFPNRLDFSGSLSGAQNAEPDLAVDLPAAGVGGGAAGSLGMRLGHIANNTTLDLELSAIEAEGNGKIISSPRVVTSNQQEATIKQGTEIPYQEATSSGATNISFQEAVLSLGVTPQITPDGSLILDVEASNDSVAQNTAAGPAIDTEEVETQVLVDDGETLVIGGIYAKAEREDETGVPFLRKIPLIGALFRSRTTTTQKDELLIFLTPRIVEDKATGGRQVKQDQS